MGILEIVAEKRLGTSALAHHTALKSNLRKIEKAAAARPVAKTSDEEKQRIAAIVELCFEYDREKDRMERKNILRTLQEIASNEPIELPTQTVQKWDEQLVAEDKAYARLRRRDENRVQDFLKKYFSFRAKARLKTQADVARKAGLSRTHVTVIESGEHMPQQKTLQRLAKAFGVDVTALM